MSYRLSCLKFTIRVETNAHGYITHAAPIARRFIGQPLTNLVSWMQRLGGFTMEEL